MIIKNKTYTTLGILFMVLCLASFATMHNVWMIIPGFVCGVLFLAFGLHFKDRKEVQKDKLRKRELQSEYRI